MSKIYRDVHSIGYGHCQRQICWQDVMKYCIDNRKDTEMLWQTGLGFDNLGSILYLPTLTRYAWVSHLWTIDINLTHQGQFLTPDSLIQTSCSEKTSFHFRFVRYYFFALYNNRKSFQMPTIRSNRKYLEYLQPFSAMFESLRKIVWNLRKWLRRFGNPGHDETKIPHIWPRKSWQVQYTPDQTWAEYSPSPTPGLTDHSNNVLQEAYLH